MKQRFHSCRACLGGMALALGITGLLLFSIGIPITIFSAHFWAGMAFREGPQPTAEQLQLAVDHDLWWGILHRLLPMFVISIALIGYGVYEAHKELEEKS